jgi:hypothetical protein
MAPNLADVAGCSAADRAWAITALAVGGLLFSRAANDEEISDRILAVVAPVQERGTWAERRLRDELVVLVLAFVAAASSQPRRTR